MEGFSGCLASAATPCCSSDGVVMSPGLSPRGLYHCVQNLHNNRGKQNEIGIKSLGVIFWRNVIVLFNKFFRKGQS